MKTNHSILLLLLLLASGPCFGQWSTSTKTDSALYVCPGFYSGIVTFDDGSSIIVGILDSYIFAQKLDPYGYKIWPQPVMVMHVEGALLAQTDYPGHNWGRAISDGDGGIFILWYDHRDAIQDSLSQQWITNSLYVQHVTKNGTVQGNQNGLLISPDANGKKTTYALCSDGQGGVIIGWNEWGLNHSGAPNRNTIRITRISSTTDTVWSKLIDSDTGSHGFSAYALIQLGDRVIFRSSIGNLVYSVSGQRDTTNYFPESGFFVRESDSTVLQTVYLGNYTDSNGIDNQKYRTAKYDRRFHIIWECNFEHQDETGDVGYVALENPLISDGAGSLFYIRGFGFRVPETRANRIDARGLVWGSNKVDVLNDFPVAGFASKGKVGIFFDKGTAQLYDSLGNALWDTNRTQVISDPRNAYFGMFGDDHNCGGIYCFWRTGGVGIYAVHTGRSGKAGIITSGPSGYDSPLPSDYALLQNYPNPFNPSTTIAYRLPSRTSVSIAVYSLLGQKILDQHLGVQEAGSHTILFSAQHLASGTYLYELVTDGHVRERRKMLLLR